ncbi:hypothetical protein A7D00_5522 [Trichophyton violaceum]|uniref:RING-type domain-containing protein n=1 Tax=Trichophyton violaceum TaxID=34388 RepID=A0A178FEK9_TRIVO|nr:hypothetical protein A7D00_5522 [Trichophyton violaceum]
MGSIFSGHASYTPLWHSDPTPDYWSSSIGDDAHSIRIVPVSEQERLEDIIGISLERTCYGFAPSQGRRCRNPIARHSLNIASSPLVLCRRYHQYQAAAVSQRWAEKVASSLAQGQPAYVIPTRSPLSQRQSAYASQSTTRRVRAPIPPRSVGFGGRASDQRDTSSGQPTVVPVPRPIISRQSISQPPIAHLPTALSNSSNTTPVRYTARKSIKPNEDCPVCQEVLVPGLRSRRHARPLDGPRTTWCMAQCGSNFHTECIEEWKRSFSDHVQPSCPCCRTPWMNHGDYSWPEVEEEEEEEESTTDSNDSRNATQPLPYASRGSSEQDSSGQSNEEQLEKEETSSGDYSPEEENLVAYTLSDNEGSTASSIEAVDQVEPEGAGTDLENPNIEDHTLLPENNTSTSALIPAPDYTRETPSQPILEQYISPSVDSSLAGTYSHATTQTEISIPQFINRDDKDDDPDHGSCLGPLVNIWHRVPSILLKLS